MHSCIECGCGANTHIVLKHLTVCSGGKSRCWACVRDNASQRFLSVVMGFNDSETLLKPTGI